MSPAIEDTTHAPWAYRELIYYIFYLSSSLTFKISDEIRLRMIKKENDSLQQNYTILVTLPPYLSFSSFGIMNKSHAVNTATDSVLRHPLMSVLPSLCGNGFDSRASTQ